MNTALLHALDEEGKTLINIDLIEGSHEANAFDKRLPRPLASKAAAFASQIVELSSCSNVTIIGQGKLVNDILKAAIKANKCQSTINFLGLSHPTNGSASAFGNHLAFSFAAEMNHVFHQFLEKVNWKGLILQYGPRSDKHNGKGGVFSSIIGDRSSENFIDIPTRNPHINVVVHCNALGIFDDNDVRLESMIGHLAEPHTRTALYLSMKGTEGGIKGGINSNATDPNCQPGEHWMEEEDRYSWSTLARVTKAGIASHDTIEGEEDGVHWKRKGVGAGVDLTMPTLERVTKAGTASADTIEGEKRGTHWKRHGKGKGVVKTMSMAERAEETTGIPRKGGIVSTILVPYHEDKIYYSLTNDPMFEKMVGLQVFNSKRNARDNIWRLKDYASEGKFQLKLATKGGDRRKDFVPYRGACGRDMPTDLNVWLSVGKIPKGDNVTVLKKQSKRKRAEDEGN